MKFLVEINDSVFEAIRLGAYEDIGLTADVDPCEAIIALIAFHEVPVESVEAVIEQA